jgi:hypothetical protein
MRGMVDQQEKPVRGRQFAPLQQMNDKGNLNTFGKHCPELMGAG